jgi:hypothetical protein
VVVVVKNKQLDLTEVLVVVVVVEPTLRVELVFLVKDLQVALVVHLLM